MRTPTPSQLVIATIGLLAASVAVTSAPSVMARAQPDGGARPAAPAARDLPLVFEANGGQADPEALFMARGPGSTLFLTAQESVLRLDGGDVVRMTLEGSRPHPLVEGVDRLEGTVNYYAGTDPSAWRSGIPTFAKVAYREVYPGVDLVHYGARSLMEYDFVVAPGADPSAIALAFTGTTGSRIDSAGDLVLSTPGGEVRHRRPVAYQEGSSGRRAVEATFELEGGRLGFALGAYDRARPLVIDPVVYSTLIGGTRGEQTHDVAVDRFGNAVIVGSTESPDYPTLNPVGSDGGFDDAIVTKFNRTGSALVYSTYLSGLAFNAPMGNDGAISVDLDSAGNAYVVGKATLDFPTTPGAAMTCTGHQPFVTKLSPTGSLVYSTCYGGSDLEVGLDIDVDGEGNAYLSGITHSADFPTVNAYQPTFAHAGQPYSVENKDGFVVKLNPTGTGALWATYLGGTGEDATQGLVIDASGIYLSGFTTSADFPMAGTPFQSTRPGGITDLFVTKLSLSGSMIWSTFLGGSGRDGHTTHLPIGIAVDRQGRVVVSDATFSTDYPTTAGVLQPAAATPPDFVVTKLDANGSSLVFSTYLGGNNTENGGDYHVGLALDPNGNVYLAGRTQSSDLPTATPVQSLFAGTVDAYVAKLGPAGANLLFATYLGGTGGEAITGAGMTLDPGGNAYVTALTTSADFPTTPGAYQRTLTINPDPRWIQNEDAFLVKYFIAPWRRAVADLDGDGRSDFSVFRPGNGGWFTSGGLAEQFGTGGDIPVPADYDGDVRSDLAVFRPSTGLWAVRHSGTGADAPPLTYGVGTDRPVPADYDGDGRADVAVFRPSLSTWFIRNSTTGSDTLRTFGLGSDIPVPGDYDGDGKADLAVFRPSTGTWFAELSAGGSLTRAYGATGDIPAPGDYDGDGRTDTAIFRPSTGLWSARGSSTGTDALITYGVGSDRIVPADYDGDGRTDVAVLRPSLSTWFARASASNSDTIVTFGLGSDIPLALPDAIRRSFY